MVVPTNPLRGRIDGMRTVLLLLLAAFVDARKKSAPSPPPKEDPPWATALEYLVSRADDCHITVDALVIGLICCGVFTNKLWRFMCFGAAYLVAVPFAVTYKANACPVAWYVWPPYLFLCLSFPVLAWLNGRHKKQPVKGAVFVTGADSGMGQWTASALCGAGYHVFAGVFTANGGPGLLAKVSAEHGPAALARLTTKQLDVCSDESVAAAAEMVGRSGKDLVGVINCAGVGHTGPAEYFPMKLYKAQMEVNFFGYVRVIQALLPFLKQAAAKPGARRGRIVCIGTGGGTLSPSPPLISAYMASKWSVEAYVQSLRFELQLRKLRIDACMVNPGVVKPTALASIGESLIAKMWDACEPEAQEEYGGLLEQLVEHQSKEPGTHVSAVSDKMVEIMAAGVPRSTNYVGPDSASTPYVGLLPTGVREFIIKFVVFKRTDSV